MAAGSNWKRPWEDATREDRDFPAPPLAHSRHASVSTPQPMAPNTQHAAMPWPQTQTQTQTSTRGIGRNSQPASSSTCAASLLNRDTDKLEENYGYTGPLPRPYKRQRVGDGEANIAHETSLFTPPVAATHLQSLQDSYYERTRHLEKFSARESPIPLNDGWAMELRNIGGKSGPLYQRDAVNEDPSNICRTCAELQSLVPEIVSVADGLYEDMVIALQRALPEQHKAILSKKCRRPRPIGGRLCQSVEWVLKRLNASFELGKALATLRVQMPRSDQVVGTHDEQFQERTSYVDMPRARWEKDDKFNDQSRKQYSPQSHDDLRRIDVFRPPSLPGAERRRSIASDVSRQQMTSPPPAAAPPANYLVQPDSPMHAPPSARHLPSPSPLNFSSSSQFLPPLSPSYPGPKSPHTAHLQELQHQLSTKSLAHQILQGEHDKLLAAYSRLQTRCATLDKKSQVSDTEIDNLAEDRARLEGQVAALESQVGELQFDRDEAHKQSAASCAQYMKILAMSSKLQAPGTADMEKWKADKEAWEKQKEALLSKGLLPPGIGGSAANNAQLSKSADATPVGASSQPSTHRTVNSREIPSSDDPGNVLASTSVERLREEIVRLRKSRLAMEASLEAWRADSIYVNDTLLSLGTLNDRMRQRYEGLGTQMADLGTE